MRLLIISALTCLVTFDCYAGNISFRGNNVQDPETGITILSENDIMIISNPIDHYALVLPNSKNWDFSFEIGRYLKGKSNRTNVSLSMYQSKEDTNSLLHSLKKKLESKSNPVRLESSELITYKKTSILKTVINAEQIDRAFSDVKHINYYSIKKWGDATYQLHISKVVPEAEIKNTSDKEFLNFTSAGFIADFER